jgi:hypothetical protein
MQPLTVINPVDFGEFCESAAKMSLPVRIRNFTIMIQSFAKFCATISGRNLREIESTHGFNDCKSIADQRCSST